MGIGADDPDTEAWPVVLHRRLPEGSLLHRLGVSGSVAEEAIIDQVPHAEAIAPNLITVWLVINDFRNGVSLADYRRHLDEIVGRAVRTGSLVLVGNMPDLVGMPEFATTHPDELRILVRSWNAAIEDVVVTHGAVLVDLLAASEGLDEDKSLLLSAEDRFHPSTLGHLAIAEIFSHYLEIALEAQKA